MVISLTGFMGSGKSCTGAALAALADWQFVDLDAYLEHKVGESIPAIFERRGETEFRALEAEAVRDVLIMSKITGTDTVLALGGGTFTIKVIRDYLLQESTCIWLKASAECLKSRLASTDLSARPVLATSSFEDLLSSREPLYALAPHTIITDGLTPEEVARRCLAEMK